MTSITDSVRQIIQSNSFLSESLRLGLLNTSEYARQIQDQVEKLTWKKVKVATIVTSLNRIRSDFEAKLASSFLVDDIQLKFPITDIVFDRTSTSHQKIAILYAEIGRLSNNFLNVIEGNTETNIFVNSAFEHQVHEVFSGDKPIFQRSNLAAVILKFDIKFIDIPGSTFSVLRLISMSGINLIEVLSTYTELTIFVDLGDSQRVIEIVKENFLTRVN